MVNLVLENPELVIAIGAAIALVVRAFGSSKASATNHLHPVFNINVGAGASRSPTPSEKQPTQATDRQKDSQREAAS